MVVHSPVKRMVAGSSPALRATMINEKELKKEIRATKKFLKSLKIERLKDYDEVYAYLDGLTYALKGKLD